MALQYFTVATVETTQSILLVQLGPVNPGLQCTLKLSSNLALPQFPVNSIGVVNTSLVASSISMNISSTGSLPKVS